MLYPTEGTLNTETSMISILINYLVTIDLFIEVASNITKRHSQKLETISKIEIMSSRATKQLETIRDCAGGGAHGFHSVRGSRVRCWWETGR